MDVREGTKRQEPDRNKRRATSFLRAAATDGGRWPACLALTAGVAAGGWLQPWAICRGRGGAARRHHVSARLIISCLPPRVLGFFLRTPNHPHLSLSLSRPACCARPRAAAASLGLRPASSRARRPSSRSAAAGERAASRLLPLPRAVCVRACLRPSLLSPSRWIRSWIDRGKRSRS